MTYKQDWTPEPWATNTGRKGIFGKPETMAAFIEVVHEINPSRGERLTICEMEGPPLNPPHTPNAERIVETVNALAGVAGPDGGALVPDSVRELVEAAAGIAEWADFAPRLRNALAAFTLLERAD